MKVFNLKVNSQAKIFPLALCSAKKGTPLFYVMLVTLVSLWDISIAESDPSGYFIPSKYDQSLAYLRQIFGSIGPLTGTDGNLSGILFRTLNIGFISFIGMFASFTAIQAVLVGATDGTGLKNKIRSLTLIRIVVSVMLVAPLPSGYSTIQTSLMYVTYWGVGFADNIWSTAIKQIKESKGAFASEFGGKEDSNFKDIDALVNFTGNLSDNTTVTPAEMYQSALCNQTIFRLSQEYRDGLTDSQVNTRGWFGDPDQYKMRTSERKNGSMQLNDCQLANDTVSGQEDFFAVCFGGPDTNTSVKTAEFSPSACGTYYVKKPISDDSEFKYNSLKKALRSAGSMSSVSGKIDFDQLYYDFKKGTKLKEITKKRRYCSNKAELEKMKRNNEITSKDVNFILNTPSGCIGANNFIATATDYQLAIKNARIEKVVDAKVNKNNKNIDQAFLDEARNFGWMTVGMYYGKLSSQGTGASSTSKVVMRNNLGDFKPKFTGQVLSQKALFGKSPNQNSPVYKAYDYFFKDRQSMLFNYSTKAKEVVQNIQEASTMNSMLETDSDVGKKQVTTSSLNMFDKMYNATLGKLFGEVTEKKVTVSGNISADNVMGKVAAYYSSKLLLDPIGMDRVCMGTPFSIPASVFAVFGAGAIASGAGSMAFGAALGVMAVTVLATVTACLVDIPGVPKVDIVYRNIIKSVNMVLKELIGVNIYKTGTKLGQYNSYHITRDLNRTCKNNIIDFCKFPRKKNDYAACLKKLENKDNKCVELGTGLLGQHFASKQGFLVDPYHGLQRLGQIMMIAAVSYWDNTYRETFKVYTLLSTIVYAAKLVTTTIGSVVIVAAGSAFKPYIIFGNLAIGITNQLLDMVLQWDLFQLNLFKTFGGALAGIMYASGTLLAVLIPLLPMLIYLIASLGWLFMVIEGMIAAPLVALGLAHPSTHDYLGRSQQAFLLYFIIFLRPALITMGFIFAMLLSYVAVKMLNFGFLWMTSSMIGMNLGASSSNNSVKYLVELISLASSLIVYVYVNIMVIMYCFSYIFKLPEEVSKWFGGASRASMGSIEGVMSDLESQVGESSGGVSSGASRMTQQRPNLGSFVAEGSEGLHGHYKQGKEAHEGRVEAYAQQHTKEGQKYTTKGYSLHTKYFYDGKEITKDQYNKGLKEVAKTVKYSDVRKDLIKGTLSGMGFNTKGMETRGFVKGTWNSIKSLPGKLVSDLYKQFANYRNWQ